ncbi:AlpA family transcriptional regulator [Sphingomonas aerolata]|uniref:helix-turn-helix transcriptional regulator n=1 Tax=Sphingomonas aerolata TaxID=185951 RepID=UPI002FDF33EA
MSASNVATGKYLRLPDVKAETGLGKTSIYQLIRDGQFPKPVKISSRAVAWREGAIEAWKADRQAQSDKT